jgi:phosphopantothenoylcysteine decarboxylase/phosphopantothenate--cysteine ligase
MNVLLGVSGSIAAYRAADLARDMMRAGFTVRVCLTDAAQRFVTPILFETLTGHLCLIDTFQEPEQGRMAHIDWARSADIVVVAPATANTINKLANGIGDDMLTTIVLATTCPLVIAPAMNPQMFANDTTQTSLEVLSARAATIVKPQEGDVACGEHGEGKLASNAEILAAVSTVATLRTSLRGRHVVITSGPTQEPLDDVRFLSNRSSGKMGVALARAAILMGAQVTVVTGPVRVMYPLGASVVRVQSAEQMLEATLSAAEGADIVIGAAAVADYRPSKRFSGKIRRSLEPMTVELTPNPDIIATVAQTYPKAIVVGFAAEPTSDLEVAREKLKRKHLAAIAVNDISQDGIGFDSEENELTLVSDSAEPALSGRKSKLGCAIWLLERISEQSALG